MAGEDGINAPQTNREAEQAPFVITFGSEIGVPGEEEEDGRRFIVTDIGNSEPNQRSIEAAEMLNKPGEPLLLGRPGTTLFYQIDRFDIGPTLPVDEVIDGLNRFEQQSPEVIAHYREQAVARKQIDLSQVSAFG